jgi:hydrogenase expression/formation protein HypE
MTADLIARWFLAFATPISTASTSGGGRDRGRRLAFTTDWFMVRPLFFPGGDGGPWPERHGERPRHGRGPPLYLSAGSSRGGLLPTTSRDSGLDAGRVSAGGCAAITGDTKVVNKGMGDQRLINTTRIGVVEHSRLLSADQARPDDRVILRGTIGDHGRR